MSVYRSTITQNLYKRPNPYRSSLTTLHLSGSLRCHRDPFTSRIHAHSTASSPVAVGTSYEHLCARTLPRLGFQALTRVGGRADKGIDLLGTWLPFGLKHTEPPPLNVVVQCKAVAGKPVPEMIRGLEGALAGARGEWRGENTIGVLCAKKGVTPGVRDALKRSKRGVVWVMVEDVDGAAKEGREGNEEVAKGTGDSQEDRRARKGRIKQVLWNDRVQELLGEGTGTGVVHIPGDGGRMETEVLMSWNGILAVPD